MINVTNNHSPPYTNTYTPLINSHHTPGSLPCHDELPPHPTRTHSSPPPLQTSSFSHCLHTRSSALEPNFGMGARRGEQLEQTQRPQWRQWCLRTLLDCERAMSCCWMLPMLRCGCGGTDWGHRVS